MRRPLRAEDRRLRRPLAAGLLPVAVFVAAAAPPEASLGTTAAPPAAHVSLDFAGASTASLSLPACGTVVLTANGIAGLAPFAFTWDTDLGEVLPATNPISFDTAGYTGSHRITVHVTNQFGEASLDSFFTIDALATPMAVATSPNPTAGLSVAVTGTAVGATEWQWLWGDGTTSPWSTDCAALQASHTYLQTGTYLVQLRSKSCNAGPLESTPVSVRVRSSSIFSEGFETGGLGAWSGNG